MPSNTPLFAEKALFLLIDSSLVGAFPKTQQGLDKAQQHQALCETIFQPLHEKIIAYQKAGFVCTIQFLIINPPHSTNTSAVNTEDVTRAIKRPFQPENESRHAKFLFQLSEWLLSKNISTVTVNHFHLQVSRCVFDDMAVSSILQSQQAQQLPVTYTWIYIQLIWQFLMEIHTPSTLINIDVQGFFAKKTDLLALTNFFNQYLFLLPKHTHFNLPHTTPIEGNGSFICTNIAAMLPAFISSFPMNAPTENPRKSLEAFMDSPWIKKLNQNARPKIKTSRQVISDLATKLSAVKNIQPTPKEEVRTENDYPTPYSMNHAEWRLFSTHSDDLQRERTFKIAGTLKGALAHHNNDDSADLGKGPDQIKISRLAALKFQLQQPTSKCIRSRESVDVYETTWRPQNSNDTLFTTVKKDAMKHLRAIANGLQRPNNELLLEHHLTMQCTHPGIGSYVASGKDEKDAYLIIEHSGHESLEERLKKRPRPLPQNVAQHFFVQICLAVDYLHSHQIMHRDLKPANIVIDDYWNATLINMDYAIENKQQKPLTLPFTNDVVGTLNYMAPEVCQKHDYGCNADLWSMGIILYEMLELNAPFDNKNPKTLAQAICNPAIPVQPRKNMSTDHELNQLLERLLDKNPETRISSIGDIFLQFPSMRHALTTFYRNFESQASCQTSNQDAHHKKHLFSIGMLKAQCNRIFTACQSYDDQIKEKAAANANAAQTELTSTNDNAPDFRP